jgi:hypothetical protein
MSPPAVIAWLMYTRDTKRELHYSVGTAPNVNIIDKSGRKRLEISLHEVIFVKCQYLGIHFPSNLIENANEGVNYIQVVAGGGRVSLCQFLKFGRISAKMI